MSSTFAKCDTEGTEFNILIILTAINTYSQSAVHKPTPSYSALYHVLTHLLIHMLLLLL